MAAVELHDDVSERLRGVGQLYTAGRRRLVEALARADRPLTVPEILRSAPGLAASSAYRNLTVLVDAGVVAKVVTGQEHARFELATSLTQHHHHLVCEVCGSVSDFTLGDEAERELDRSLARVARAAGFADVDHRLDVVGTCPDCQQRLAERAAG